MNKIVVILGPTASGKTSLSIKLAKKFNGEVVSADSRQVYKGMDIGTGKVTKKEMASIPHYLLDVASPNARFTVAQFQKLAKKALKKIHKKGKLPFLVGGTGFYIQAVVDNLSLPKVKPDWKLRKNLEKLSNEELFKKLKKLDPKRAKSIDRHNPRRLIRAIEIILKTGKPVPSLEHQTPDVCCSRHRVSDGFDILIIGVKKSPKELKELIKKRLLKRLRNNPPATLCKRACSRSDAGGEMVNEVKKLHKKGVSWKRLEEFGLEYRYIALYLQNKLTYDEMAEKLEKEIWHYAKRQITWFKKDKRIKWVGSYKETAQIIDKFINRLYDKISTNCQMFGNPSKSLLGGK